MVQRFVHSRADGFRKDLVYVEFDGKQSWMILNTGERCLLTIYRKDLVEQYVREGEWKEWPFDSPWSLQGIGGAQ